MVPRIPVERVIEVEGKGGFLTLADAGVALAASGQTVLRRCQRGDLDLHICPVGRPRYLVSLKSISDYLERVSGGAR